MTLHYMAIRVIHHLVAQFASKSKQMLNLNVTHHFRSTSIHFQFTNKSSLNRVTFILLPPHQSVLKKYLERRRSKVSAFQIVPNKNKTPPKKKSNGFCSVIVGILEEKNVVAITNPHKMCVYASIQSKSVMHIKCGIKINDRCHYISQ